jgi:predicted PurR-regulated permease PerM
MITDQKWARRRDIAIATLAWAGMILLILWGAGHVIWTLLLLFVAALLAYALVPLVTIFQKVMPRFLAILLVYLIVLVLACLLFYYIVITAIHQVQQLIQYIQYLTTTPAGKKQIADVEGALQSIGISQAQLTAARDQIIARIESSASNVLPFLSSFLTFLVDIILVAIMSIYFVADGAKFTLWLRRISPRISRINLILDTIQHVARGYIRGQLTMSTLISLLVGIGMALFHVPYALLLGVLAFLLEFVPILGVIVSGALCTLLALTQGWLIALGVLLYFIGIHILEGDVIGPRVIGGAVGLHPIVAIAALIAGGELFGLWGVLFAAPVAGILQALLITFWMRWRAAHPEQFGPAKAEFKGNTDKSPQNKPDTTEEADKNQQDRPDTSE